MDSKIRMNVERDRLSSLPDELIHKILSSIDIKKAVETSLLSSRWRIMWTSMPYLNFSSEGFSTLPEFAKFVTHVLSGRNNLSEVYSVKLNFRGKVSQVFVKRVLNYAFSHNIQQLDVVWLHDSDMDFPLSVLSSQSLKHLSLTMHIGRCRRRREPSCSFTPTSTLKLPTLTTLDLHCVTLCDDEVDKCVSVFSKCVNLKNLTLKYFKTVGSDGFSIFHPRLSNLTLECGCDHVKVVNVVAPQLENLTIRWCYGEYVISAPYLVSFLYEGSLPLHLSTEGFHSLEKADICVSNPNEANAHQIIRVLQHLHSVKFLTLNLEIVEILSASVDLILHQPSPFVNLKSLKIYPKAVYLWNLAPKKVAVSTELKSYLLDGSPGATFTLILREEIAAHKLMVELGVLLKKEKANIKTNAAHLEQGKAPMESCKPKTITKLKIGEKHLEQGKASAESSKPKTKKKLKIKGNMAQVKGYWENLGVEIELRKKSTCVIISMLQRIEELLTTLPPSHRANIQPCLSSLCADANIAISKITDCMKNQCDEVQSRSSVCFHELAKTLELDS